MKLSKFILPLLLFLFFSTPIFAQENSWTEKITPEIVLKTISLIEQEPLGSDFEGAVSIVVHFAEQSKDVIVTMNQEILPWVGRENLSKKASLLIGVFIAGNIKNQIIAGIPKDHSYEGLILTIKTYTVWRKENLIEKIPELEEWSTFDSKKLHALIDKDS